MKFLLLATAGSGIAIPDCGPKPLDSRTRSPQRGFYTRVRTSSTPLETPPPTSKKAFAVARQTGKRILLDIGGSWCSWCQVLDQLFESNPELQRLLDANFIAVKIYYGAENKNEKALSRYSKLLGIPHFFILENNRNFAAPAARRRTSGERELHAGQWQRISSTMGPACAEDLAGRNRGYPRTTVS